MRNPLHNCRGSVVLVFLNKPERTNRTATVMERIPISYCSSFSILLYLYYYQGVENLL